MDAVMDELLREAKAPAQRSTTPATQSSRNEHNLRVLTTEYHSLQDAISKETDPQKLRRLNSYVGEITKEINGLGGKLPATNSAPISAGPTGTNITVIGGGATADPVMDALLSESKGVADKPATPAATQTAPQAQRPSLVEWAAAGPQLLARIGSGLASTIPAAAAGLNNLPRGLDAAADAVRNTQQAMTYQPRGEAGQTLSQIWDSKYNPVHWPAKLGEMAGNAAVRATGSPLAATLIDQAVNLATGGVALKAIGAMTRVPGAATPRVEPSFRGAPQQAPAAAPAAPVAAPPRPVNGSGPIVGGNRGVIVTEGERMGTPVVTGEVRVNAELPPIARGTTTDSLPRGTVTMPREGVTPTESVITGATDSGIWPTVGPVETARGSNLTSQYGSRVQQSGPAVVRQNRAPDSQMTMPREEAPKAERPESMPQATVETAGQAAELSGVGAARASFDPEVQLVGGSGARGQIPQYKAFSANETAPAAEIAKHQNIAAEIAAVSGEEFPLRPGVMNRNDRLLRQEYVEAKMNPPTPRGLLLKETIEREQRALEGYSQAIVDRTGASRSMVDDHSRGSMINGAFYGDEGLTGFLKQEKKALYDAAYKAAGDAPVNAANLERIASDKAFESGLKMAGQKDFLPGLREILEQHRETGFGEVSPGVPAKAGSVQSLQNVSKYVNTFWTPANRHAIGRVQEAIALDTAKVAGAEAYARAKSLHAAEKSIFESKGISKIFGDVDQNGVPTAQSFEKIPKDMARMPIDQWKHIYDTLDQLSKGRLRGYDFDLPVPSEVMMAAEAAKAEVRGAIAREVYRAGAGKAGVWNQNSANKAINELMPKIKAAFDPAEQRMFEVLNSGGYLMPGEHNYLGAGLQREEVGMIKKYAPAAAGSVASVASHGNVAVGIVVKEGVDKGFKWNDNRRAHQSAKQFEEEGKRNMQQGMERIRNLLK